MKNNQQQKFVHYYLIISDKNFYLLTKHQLN
jgi:hypothetical protein